MHHKLLALLALCLTTFLYFGVPWRHAPISYSLPAGVTAANATLGFGAVLAVSRPQSPRREELLFAANLTGVEITIPLQPKWTDADVARLKADRGSKITRGSALAWLGHLNALKWYGNLNTVLFPNFQEARLTRVHRYRFLESGLETALILEDDVDWDIRLRTVEVPLVAKAFRKLLHSDATYWADLSQWEMIHLGHCGDIFSADKFKGMPHERFVDNTLPPLKRMHTKTQAFLQRLGFGEYERMIHRSSWPLCTFGYAVTQASARRISTELAARETDGGKQAFDVRTLEACRDLGYKCYSANPELFHHTEAPSEIAEVNQGTDEHGRLQAQSTDVTPNIACGARSKQFFTNDKATLDFLKMEVGEKGHCLLDEMEPDRSKWPWVI
ncbi:hypothetical protein W97_02193 [Coniosporium apollinis CBS 100218]|uniref:Glycosyltransferase family 25 protein n=1 Tax=Coniosporium apollinis (strain CBS 100218) TaxID=1168221 RepID=R7YM31_CONA1|nr:uncharacterized protein W97_02193 [Coniosporium apollinis CBS 100218]EON62967.1 hypothetical protein W97_02193 [Coniosporium apollinis CBS 100218]